MLLKQEKKALVEQRLVMSVSDLQKHKDLSALVRRWILYVHVSVTIVAIVVDEVRVQFLPFLSKVETTNWYCYFIARLAISCGFIVRLTISCISLIKSLYRSRDHCKNMEEDLTKGNNIVAHVMVLRRYAHLFVNFVSLHHFVRL